MGTKKQELIDGCFAKAADDEPLFVLRAKDMLAPGIVRAWVAAVASRCGIDVPPALRAKLAEAKALADHMEGWQREHGCKVPD